MKFEKLLTTIKDSQLRYRSGHFLITLSTWVFLINLACLLLLS